MEGVVTNFAEFWSGKRVLLTGHTGFKGAWCALWLRRMGAVVFGLALEPEAGPSIHRLLGDEFDQGSIGDIRHSRVVQDRFEVCRPEIVLHMAAQALVHPSYVNPASTFETNVMGLINILDAARNCDSVRVIVNVTSDKCYENTEQIWAYRETEPFGGSDPYSASKGCAELVTTSYRRSFFNTQGAAFLASARAGNVIGGGDWSVDRLIPDCMRSFKAGEAVLIRNPLATRPWQHVLEPISGYLLLAQSLYEGGHEFAEGWNFGPMDSDAWPVKSVVDRVVELWGHNASWKLDGNVWPKESMLLRVDPTKARVRLKWRPQLQLSTALSWTIDWYRAVDNGQSALEISVSQIEAYQSMAGLN